MIEIGRLCIKIAGRDSGKKCVIVDILDDSFVLIDGETRRRKCNMRHLEPLKESIKIKKAADHTVIVSEFKKLGIELTESKPRKPTEKQKQLRSADRKKLAPKETKEKAKESKDKDTGSEVKPVAESKVKKEAKSEKDVKADTEKDSSKESEKDSKEATELEKALEDE